MGHPAARVGDQHICPDPSPQPHIGGVITGDGASSVLIGGAVAAIIGDDCVCTVAPNSIVMGSSGVWIEGQPAARWGDRCHHGGMISAGCVTVLIGGKLPGSPETDFYDYVELLRIGIKSQLYPPDFKLPCPDTQKALITVAIVEAIALLQAKFRLIRKGDFNTMRQFRVWFGNDHKESKMLICKRIIATLRVIKYLSHYDFSEITEERGRQSRYAQVYPVNETHTIYVGYPFWSARTTGKNSRAGIIIHELSHFPTVGSTEDYAYSEHGCKYLATWAPPQALKNADNFEYFLES